MAKGDHVKVENTKTGGYRFFCEHCGVEYEPALPCPLDVFTSIMGSFADSHENCPEPNKEATPR